MTEIKLTALADVGLDVSQTDVGLNASKLKFNATACRPKPMSYVCL